MTQTTQYSTLGEVNDRIRQLGFVPITAEKAKEIQQRVARNRFIDALKQAHANENARLFLARLLDEPQVGQRDERADSLPERETHDQNQEPAQQQQGSGPAQQRGQTPDGRQSHRTQTRPATSQEQRGATGKPDHAANAGQQHPNAPASSDNRAEHGTASESKTGRRRFHSYHVYGGKAALCWEDDTTRAGEATVRLEAASATGPRQYDWSNKVIIQLTRDELPCVAAVFLGLIPEAKGSNHGQGDNGGKWFEIQHQGSKLFCKVGDPQSKMKAVPIEAQDAYWVATLLIRQIRAARPWLSGEDVVMLLRTIIARMKSSQG